MKLENVNLSAVQYEPLEWGYRSSKVHLDPFNEIEMDVIATHQDGQSWRIPGYWSGGQEWRIRFAPPLPGRYGIESVASDQDDPGLHGRYLTIQADNFRSENRLLKHGTLHVSESRRNLAFEDGTPFFWFGDTWWMGLSSRLSWPEDFQLLAADRTAKGFNVIQIVAGLYPDMPASFDPRSKNEAGFPWEDGYARINPAYFDMADLRIQWLVRVGLLPCILGSWGYYLLELGLEKMKKHWRYLIARWGAYPVLWCLAGEGLMPYYLSENPDQDREKQKHSYTELGRYVHEIDPYHRLVMIHPTMISRDQINDDTILDFNLLQIGHSGYKTVPNTVDKVVQEHSRKPTMPVIVSEVNYEGIMQSTQAEFQRLTFWSAILSGACGFTYGANGIWQVNQRNKPYGPSPHGGTWGNTPWEDAYRLPGSTQLGLASRFLQRYRWWQFEPHPEWVTPSGSSSEVDAPFAAGIPRQIRIIYLYNPVLPWAKQPIKILAIETDCTYRAFYWDPINGDNHEIGQVVPQSDGSWEIPVQPEMRDWVLVLESSIPDPI